jgi:pyruvate kinase
MNRCAKIIATVGPACQEESVLRTLIQAGMDIARLNFSHGSYADHHRIYHLIRKLSNEMGRPVSILQDLQGPKIRTGIVQDGQVELSAGQKLILTVRPVSGDAQVIPVDFPEIITSAKPGGRILLDDGNLELAIISVNREDVETRVVLGGILKSHKGINLPGAKIDIPGFTSKDEADLKFGLELGVDAVAISFVRSAQDIQQVHQAIARFAPDRQKTPVIAKLERPEALDNLDEIVRVADGVMVARGDLGVEMSPEEVPIAQKCIIESANRQCKLVITATQMLDSMIHSPRPTRAEASDVANAIFDGSDVVMLSGETAAGQYPLEAVQMMDAIVLKAEANMQKWGHWKGPDSANDNEDDAYFVTRAACELAHDRNVAAVAVFTKTGRSAQILSKVRPGVPILAFTPEEHTYHRLNLLWGVAPHLVTEARSISEMIHAVEEVMTASAVVQSGQQVVLICGFPVHKIRSTNLAMLHTVGEPVD